MKKVMILGIVIMVLSCCSCGSRSVPPNGEMGKMKDIPIMADYMSFDYDELKAYASLIVKVKAADELSEQNTVVQKDPEDPDTIMDVHSLRTAEILELYKNDTEQKLKKGDILSVIEMTGIAGNRYFHSEGYEKLEKGNIYILFLNNDTQSGEYSIISANTGKVDLEHLADSEQYDIAVKAAIEYASGIEPAEKEKIIKSTLIRQNDKLANPHTRTFNIGKEEVKIHYKLDTKKNETYVKVD